MRRLSGVLTLVVLVSLSGCGPKVAKVPLTPNQKLGTLYVGDCATYKEDIRIYAVGVLQKADLTQSQITVEAPSQRSPLSSQMAYVFNMTLSQPAKSGDRSYRLLQTDWLGVGTDGNIYQFGYTESTDLPGDMVVGGFFKNATPFVRMPAALTSSSSWNYTARCEDSDTHMYGGRVVGTEWIDTPIGKYETYKIEVTLESNKHTSYSGYVWIAPQLGCIPLKREVDITLSAAADFKMHVVDTLESIKLAGLRTAPANQAK